MAHAVFDRKSYTYSLRIIFSLDAEQKTFMIAIDVVYGFESLSIAAFLKNKEYFDTNV